MNTPTSKPKYREHQQDQAVPHIEVWRECSVMLRHYDDIFWKSVRYYTGLITVLVGGAGAVFGISGLSYLNRALLAGLFLILGGLVALLAGYVVKKQGIYIGYFNNTYSIAELELLRLLKLDDQSKERWIETRDLKPRIEKDASELGPVRQAIPLSFSCFGVAVLAAAFVLLWASTCS